MTAKNNSADSGAPRAIELFAGVGGFRLGLEGFQGDIDGKWVNQTGSGWRVVWSNQWEPSTKRVQHAHGCLRLRFGDEDPERHPCRDIAEVLGDPTLLQAIPQDIQLLVGGFPCQDYSVAKPLHQAHGLHGKKGVLWWEIERLLRLRLPRFVLLENVDRLLVSPAGHRGRDFATILACFAGLGYGVEWRVVNAADYGEPQRRKRVFIYGERLSSCGWSTSRICGRQDGVLAQALPCRPRGDIPRLHHELLGEIPDSTQSQEAIFEFVHEVLQPAFEARGTSPFASAGVMWGGEFWTQSVVADYRGRAKTLEDVLLDDEAVLRESPEYFIRPETLPKWGRLKGSKSDRRGPEGVPAYSYQEGGMPLFDSRKQESRTVVTGEGGPTPSRFKHIIEVDPSRLGPTSQREIAPFVITRVRPGGKEPGDGRQTVKYSPKEMDESYLPVRNTRVAFRRLTPVELERLNGFPDNWTREYLDDNNLERVMSDSRRAFMMGNALVVGVVKRIGEVIRERAGAAAR